MIKSGSQQSFTSGFTVGLFAGVAGYYLFGTDEGKKLRKKLSREWVVAADHLQQEGVLDPSKDYKNLDDFIKEAKTQFLQKLEVELEVPKKPPAKKRTYAKKTKPKQFKGV